MFLFYLNFLLPFRLQPEIQSPPSLKELAARTIIRHSLPVISPLSAHMTDYLASASTCSSCSGPYFTTHYQRIKFIEKPLSPAQIQQQLLDQQQQQHQTVSFHQRIPFEARLCCNHWKSEEERVKDMFAARPVTTPRDLSGDGEVVARIQHQIPASSVEEEKEDAASSTTSIISPPLRRSKSIGDRLFASSSGAVGRIFRKTTSMANLSRRSRSSSGSSSSIDEKVEGIADDEKDSTSPLPSTLSSSSNNNTTTNSSSSDPDTTTTDTALRRGVLARSKSVSFFSRIQVVVHHQQDCHQVSRSHRHLSSSSSRRTGKDISDDEHVASRSSSSSVLISPPFSSSTSSVGILPPAVLVPLSTLLAPSINPPLPTLPKISELDNSNSQQQQQLHNRKSSLNLRMRSVKRTSSLISLRRVIGGGD